MGSPRFNCVAWASRSGSLWWPVYLCDSLTMADDLHIFGFKSYYALAATKNVDIPLVYYLGTYEFEMGKAEVKEWLCPEYDLLTQEPDVDVETWNRALAEAHRIRRDGLVPYLLPSDLDSRLPPTPRSSNGTEWSVVWLFLRGKPWLPCYILDPTAMDLSRADKLSYPLVRQAQHNPAKYFLFYCFGDSSMKLYNRVRADVKPWGCPEQDGFLRGLPRKDSIQYFVDAAVDQATEFVASGCNVDLLNLPGIDFITKSPPLQPSPSQVALEAEEVEAIDEVEAVDEPMHSYPLRSLKVRSLSKPRRSPSSFESAPKLLNFPCGVAWVWRKRKWSPVILCQRDEWFTRFASRYQWKKPNVAVYCFETHSFEKLNGRFRPWNHASTRECSDELRAAGLQAVEDEVKDYVATFQKLENVLGASQQIRELESSQAERNATINDDSTAQSSLAG